MKHIRDLNITGKDVLLRLDLNVPLEHGRVMSDARLVAALPTLQYLIEAGARVAICSHLGRPKGQRQAELSLEPVASCLAELLGKNVIFVEDCVGEAVQVLLRNNQAGDVMVLENLRFHAAETDNNSTFAKSLAAPFTVFINDAFGVSHRAHASTVGVVPFVEQCGSGFLIEKEVQALTPLLANYETPFVAIVGGAKIADKIGILNTLLSRAQVVCVGGAMAYTFLKAKGVDVGNSRVEEGKLHLARELIERARLRGVSLLLPIDHVVASEFDKDATPQLLDGQSIPEHRMGLDIGLRTRQLFADAVAKAGTVFWNGPMGVFEWPSFAVGTMHIAEAVAACSGYTVVGGGDSVSAVENAGIVEQFTHVSTGGGASLAFLEQGTLVGLEALK